MAYSDLVRHKKYSIISNGSALSRILLSSQIEYLERECEWINKKLHYGSLDCNNKVKPTAANQIIKSWCDKYLEEGKMRCDKNFGTLPVLRMSLYGKFLTTTTLHRPTNPLLSRTCPSEANLDSVCSSTNMTKQTFFFEKSLIWNKQKRKSWSKSTSKGDFIDTTVIHIMSLLSNILLPLFCDIIAIIDIFLSIHLHWKKQLCCLPGIQLK